MWKRLGEIRVTDARNRKILMTLGMLSCISIVITIVFYFVNLWLFSPEKYMSPTDAFFIEGMLFLLLGLLFLLGRGGIDPWSQRAAILSALAEALYGKDTVSPDEVFRKDRWKAKGFIRLALVLILTGIFMILVYFLTL